MKHAVFLPYGSTFTLSVGQPIVPIYPHIGVISQASSSSSNYVEQLNRNPTTFNVGGPNVRAPMGLAIKIC